MDATADHGQRNSFIFLSIVKDTSVVINTCGPKRFRLPASGFPCGHGLRRPADRSHGKIRREIEIVSGAPVGQSLQLDIVGRAGCYGNRKNRVTGVGKGNANCRKHAVIVAVGNNLHRIARLLTVNIISTTMEDILQQNKKALALQATSPRSPMPEGRAH
jgi:hypothetical protein